MFADGGRESASDRSDSLRASVVAGGGATSSNAVRGMKCDFAHRERHVNVS
jgi:hypothetical protein